jgi:hypothetical protein
MMSIEDIIDILAVDLLGMIPEDEMVVITTNRGEPVINDAHSRSGWHIAICAAYYREEVPLLSMEEDGIFTKIRRIIALNRRRVNWVLEFITKLFSKDSTSSRNIAKERLRLVLVQDRANVSRSCCWI